MRAPAASLLSLLLALSLAGCPEPGPGSGGKTPPPPPPAQGGETPPPPPPDGPQQDGGGGGDGAPWELIPRATLDEVAWPMLDPVATWPAPEGLVAPEKSPVARAIDEGEIRDLTAVVQKVIKPGLRPSDPRAAIGLDALGRVFMKLGAGKAQGSASLATHPPTRPPTFCFALHTGKAQARTIEDLREQVAAVVSDELAAELKQEAHRLEPNPKATPGVGLAFLDRQGIGERFPYLYAYSAEKRLLIVMHEVPHMALDPKASPGGPEAPPEGPR